MWLRRGTPRSAEILRRRTSALRRRPTPKTGVPFDPAPSNMPFGRRSAAGKRTIVNFFREHIVYFGVETEN